jgi:hypothetical protein
MLSDYWPGYENKGSSKEPLEKLDGRSLTNKNIQVVPFR